MLFINTKMKDMPEPTESFLLLAAEERKEIFQTLSVKLGQSPAVLEKDIWVCWALQQLFTMPGSIPMAFKGGTSLSKVFNAIKRFSEDIDVTLDYRALDKNADPFKSGISNSQVKKITDSLRVAVLKYTGSVVKPYFEKVIAEQFGEGRYRVDLSTDGEKLDIYYEPLFTSTNILDHVLIEFGGRNAIEPSDNHAITPYIAPELPKLVLPHAEVTVLSGSRTFWEKATLIHVEGKKTVHRLDYSRMSRHWSDLAMLADHEIGKDALADLALLADVVKYKSIFFGPAASYEGCTNGQLQLKPTEALLELLEQDFNKMLADGMFYGEQPKFKTIVDRLAALEVEINNSGAAAAAAQG
jgi:hypothetical protein